MNRFVWWWFAYKYKFNLEKGFEYKRVRVTVKSLAALQVWWQRQGWEPITDVESNIFQTEFILYKRKR